MQTLQWLASVTAASLVSLAPPQQSPVLTDTYLPRIVYPGTYGNYCGPTPEIDISAGCLPHGRFGDDPIDAADAACQRHDLNYCACNRAWISRREAAGLPAPQAGLSALTATRGLGIGARSLLEAQGADDGYFACVSEADALLVRDGIAMRAQAQQTNCVDSGSEIGQPQWFCEANDDAKKNTGTLARFERINLALFLRALDFDLAREEARSERTVTSSRPTPSTSSRPPPSGVAPLSFKLEDARLSMTPLLPSLASKRIDAPSEISLVRLEEQRRGAFQQALHKRDGPYKGTSSAASVASTYDAAMEAHLELFRKDSIIVDAK